MKALYRNLRAGDFWTVRCDDCGAPEVVNGKVEATFHGNTARGSGLPPSSAYTVRFFDPDTFAARFVRHVERRSFGAAGAGVSL